MKVSTDVRCMAMALVILAGCDNSSGAQQNQVNAAVPDAPEAVEISAVEVIESEIVEPVIGTGTILAARTSSIGPIVEGVIEEILVRVGDRVEEGQPLFRSRQTDLVIREKELEAAFKLASAEANQAERDLNRNQGLRKKGVISTAKLDEVTARHDISSARLDMAQANLEAIKQQIKDTVVTAPYKGVITKRMVDEGVFMSNRMSGFGNSAVIELQQIDIIVAVVHLPEKHLPKLEVGTKGRLFVDGIADPIDTVIHIINDKIDIESRAIDVRLGYKNEDYAIKPGLFVRAEIYPNPRKVMLVERRAVRGSIENPYVFVADGNLARKRSVEIAEYDARQAEIISGLSPGEKILVGPNLPRLHNGVQIRVDVANVAG